MIKWPGAIYMYIPVYKPPVALPYGSRMPHDALGHHLRRLETLWQPHDASVDGVQALCGPATDVYRYIHIYSVRPLYTASGCSYLNYVHIYIYIYIYNHVF